MRVRSIRSAQLKVYAEQQVHQRALLTAAAVARKVVPKLVDENTGFRHQLGAADPNVRAQPRVSTQTILRRCDVPGVLGDRVDHERVHVHVAKAAAQYKVGAGKAGNRDWREHHSEVTGTDPCERW